MCSLFCGCSSFQQIEYTESGITNLTQLTFGKNVELHPSYSKDGNKIIFASDRAGFLELWMMPIRGSGIQQITVSNHSYDCSPNLSPDGNEVVFQSTRVTGTWNVWKLTIGNRGFTQLTDNPYGASSPVWSPDGKKILYSTNDNAGNSYLWVMESNGEEKIQLGFGVDGRWSPDGKRIVYSKQNIVGKYNYKNCDVWVMNSDGSNPMQLTTEKEKQEITPSWSPDGKWISYVVKYDTDDYYNLKNSILSYSAVVMKSEIWIINIDGGKPTQLTAFKGINIYPNWSPDGRAITFISNRGQGWNVWSLIPISTK
jgi:Tol biopolymer transport system component